MLKDNVELVKNVMDEEGWRYEEKTLSSAVAFTGGIGGFTGMFRAFQFQLIVGENEVQNYALFPMSAPPEKISEVAELVARLNFRQMFGGFLLDCESGEIRYHIAFPSAEVMRNAKEALAFLLFSPAQMLDMGSAAFTAVLTGMKSPKEAFDDCSKNQQEERK